MTHLYVCGLNKSFGDFLFVKKRQNFETSKHALKKKKIKIKIKRERHLEKKRENRADSRFGVVALWFCSSSSVVTRV